MSGELFFDKNRVEKAEFAKPCNAAGMSRASRGRQSPPPTGARIENQLHLLHPHDSALSLTLQNIRFQRLLQHLPRRPPALPLNRFMRKMAACACAMPCSHPSFASSSQPRCQPPMQGLATPPAWHMASGSCSPLFQRRATPWLGMCVGVAARQPRQCAAFATALPQNGRNPAAAWCLCLHILTFACISETLCCQKPSSPAGTGPGSSSGAALPATRAGSTPMPDSRGTRPKGINLAKICP